MKYIRGLRLNNFARFKGEHELELDNKIYSIVALNKEAPGRSNWLGKSSIPYAIRWCLTGHVPERWKKNHGVVTIGEKSGSVEIELNDGTFISRVLDKTNDLLVIQPDGIELKKDPAQDYIDSILGVGAGSGAPDVWFLAQKGLDRFVTSDPEERTDMVTRWFSLGSIVNCQDIATKQMNDETKKIEELKLSIRTTEVEYAEYADDYEAEARALEELIKPEEASLKIWDEQFKVVTQLRSKLAVIDARIAKANYASEQLTAHVAIKPERFDGEALTKAEAELVNLGEDLKRKEKDYQNSLRLKKGEFDGICPVSGSNCPVSQDVVTICKADNSRFSKIQLDYTQARAARTNASEAVVRLREQRNRYEQWNTQLEVYKSNVTLNYEEQGWVVDRPDILRQIAEAEEKMGTHDSSKLIDLRLRLAEAKRKSLLKIRLKLDIATKKRHLEELEQSRKAAVYTANIFGRNGVRKYVVNSKFAAIEGAANRILERANIDLRVSVKWGRETQTPAYSCEACGFSYGTSRKQKICPSCGTVRGFKIEDKLFITNSSVSGGADDLAGCIVQLAAGAYLRKHGGCEFGTLTIDEPFGALDEHNRTQLSNTFVTLLEQFGLEQVFVISHTPDTTDAMPGRLTVIAEGNYSRVEVTS